MTVVNWWLQPRSIVVLTDTLLTQEDGIPAAFVQKAFPLAHLGVIISGRGHSALISGWAAYAGARVLARDFDVLNELTPKLLRELQADLSAGRKGTYPGTTSIFAWGWSPGAGRVVGYAYRSGADFEPEVMADGTVCAPGFEDECSQIIAGFSGPNVPQAMLDAMLQQYAECRRNSDLAGRNNVGGDVMMTSMLVDEQGRGSISCQQIHRFPDYDDDYSKARNLIGGSSTPTLWTLVLERFG